MILTWNEADNLRRTLNSLRWATQILIVDSFSTDDTLDIAASFPNVRVVQRRFDHFADQCNFGLEQLSTPYVLSIDADYVCPDSLFDEIGRLPDAPGPMAAAFKYCVYGVPLRSTLYPPRVVLHRCEERYLRDGHAHRVHVQLPPAMLTAIIQHDDRKPLNRWFQSQVKYAALEAEKLTSATLASLGWKDRIRRWIVVAPVLTIVYCLFWKRLILDGKAGLYYTLQRTLAELLLSIELLDRILRPREE